MITPFNNTPVEIYDNILVKREDLATPIPGPSFSKVRGLIPVLERLKKEGYKTIGYTETSVSMAGWGVAWACQELGLKCIIFDPQYKETLPLHAYHREQWKKFKAHVVPIKAGMAKVNWHISKNMLNDISIYSNKSILLPLGLPFPETINAACLEAILTKSHHKVNTVVVPVGSGTVCAGVLKGFSEAIVYGIMGRTGSIEKKKKLILSKAGFQEDSLFGSPDFRLIDPGWEYTEKSNCSCPFPCHPWYDLKAWEWLQQNVNILKPPVLFWNIGALPEGWEVE